MLGQANKTYGIYTQDFKINKKQNNIQLSFWQLNTYEVSTFFILSKLRWCLHGRGSLYQTQEGLLFTIAIFYVKCTVYTIHTWHMNIGTTNIYMFKKIYIQFFFFLPLFVHIFLSYTNSHSDISLLFDSIWMVINLEIPTLRLNDWFFFSCRKYYIKVGKPKKVVKTHYYTTNVHNK